MIRNTCLVVLLGVTLLGVCRGANTTYVLNGAHCDDMNPARRCDEICTAVRLDTGDCVVQSYRGTTNLFRRYCLKSEGPNAWQESCTQVPVSGHSEYCGTRTYYLCGTRSADGECTIPPACVCVGDGDYTAGNNSTLMNATCTGS